MSKRRRSSVCCGRRGGLGVLSVLGEDLLLSVIVGLDPLRSGEVVLDLLSLSIIVGDVPEACESG